MIDSLWKEKVKEDRIKETVKFACNEIYRGRFEVIKEVDEEYIGSSTMKSRNNIAKDTADIYLESNKQRQDDSRAVVRAISEFEEDDNKSEPQMLVSDMYETSYGEEKDEPNPCTAISKSKYSTLKSTLIGEERPTQEGDKIQDKIQRSKVSRSDSDHCDGLKYRNNHLFRNIERLNDENSETIREKVTSKSGFNTKNYSSDKERKILEKSLKNLDLRNINLNQIQSLDKNVFNTQEVRNSRLKQTNKSKELKRSNFCLKSQYSSTVQLIKHESTRNSSKIDFIDQKLRKSIRESIRDNFKMSFSKLHSRNKSANTLCIKGDSDIRGAFRNESFKGSTLPKFEKRGEGLQNAESCM